MGIQEQLKETVNKFKATRDTLRVRAHLLKLENKEVINKLEESLTKIQSDADKLLETAKGGVESSGVQAHLGVMELEERIKTLRHIIEKRIDAVSANAQQTFDETQVQAHLARLEAKDVLGTKLDDLRTMLEGAQDKGTKMAKETLVKISDHINAVASKL